jgi:hypothetical protein
MQNLLPLLIVLACPLMMIFMMRGMHGGGTNTQQHGEVPTQQSARAEHNDAGDAALRIAELEREVAALKNGSVRLDKAATYSRRA